MPDATARRPEKPDAEDARGAADGPVPLSTLCPTTMPERLAARRARRHAELIAVCRALVLGP